MTRFGPGDLVSWTQIEWERRGNWSLVLEEEVRPDRVCSDRDTYDIPFKIHVDQATGIKTCNKLGRGVMSPAPKNAEEVQEFLDWFDEETTEPDGNECFNIWTPLSDEAVEGEWRSLIDGSKQTFLPWSPNYGARGPQDNSLGIYAPEPETSFYDTVGEEQESCISCTMNRSLTLYLKGLCDGSTFGKKGVRRN